MATVIVETKKAPSDVGPVLGVDPGARRIGLAVSDPACTVASGLETLKVKNLRDAVNLVAELAEERKVRRVVVGFPLNMNGSEGERAKGARLFAKLLEERSGAPVILWDERLTSVQARAELGRLGVKGAGSRDKARVDRVAATILLQSYLDSLR
jgi:putative Holliday junction resolvase